MLPMSAEGNGSHIPGIGWRWRNWPAFLRMCELKVEGSIPLRAYQIPSGEKRYFFDRLAIGGKVRFTVGFTHR
jgi:hypothetical protein